MRYILIIAMSFYALYASTIPNMAFLGYSADEWKVCTTKSDGTIKEILLEHEPRSYDYNFNTAEILYSDSSGRLRLHSKGVERELKLPYDKNAYTQPSFSCGENKAYAVELIEGNSKSTRVVLIDLKNDSSEVVVEQTSSQFEPSQTDEGVLLFTSLTCNIGCGRLIQEIWIKNRVTGESEQITLLNSFSNNPTSYYSSDWVFFSSNKNENYHIWAKNINRDDRSIQVTEGDSSDTFPAALDNENFLYVHEDSGKYSIMHGNIKGISYKMKLAKEYKKIRQLKVNRCKQ